MKKILIVFAVAAASYACGGGESEQSTTPVSNSSTSQNEQIGSDSKAAEATAPAATADAGNGKALIEGSDCRTCHQDNAKVIGPSYADVAKKYPNTPENVKMLAEKVIKGGKGNWGEIPMTPHPNLSQADAEAMVTYILSLNK